MSLTHAADLFVYYLYIINTLFFFKTLTGWVGGGPGFIIWLLFVSISCGCSGVPRQQNKQLNSTLTPAHYHDLAPARWRACDFYSRSVPVVTLLGRLLIHYKLGLGNQDHKVL